MGHLRKVAVEGTSMVPALNPGDWLIASYWRGGLLADIVGESGLSYLALHGRIPQKYFERFEKRASSLVGQVILVEREAQPGLIQIKRVIRVLESTRGEFAFWVEGDNKNLSTDSRTWGAVNATEIKGVVRFRYWRSK